MAAPPGPAPGAGDGELNPDYVFFGKLDGDTHPHAHPKNLELGEWWASMVEIPSIVMSGSEPASVIEAALTWAEFVAVGKAVFSAQGALLPWLPRSMPRLTKKRHGLIIDEVMTLSCRRTLAAILVVLASPGVGLALTAREFATDAGLVAGAPGDALQGGTFLPPDLAARPHQGFLLSGEDAVPASSLSEPPERTPYEGPVDDAYGAYQRGLFNAAYEAAIKRAGKGDPRAETLIAELVERKLIAESRAGPPDPWYRMAADSGMPFALNRYGMLLLESDDEGEHDKGRILIKQAAEAGDPIAAFNYASLLVQDSPGRRGFWRRCPGSNVPPRPTLQTVSMHSRRSIGRLKVSLMKRNAFGSTGCAARPLRNTIPPRSIWRLR
nr:thiamine phosphate synthase [Marinicella sp. W31]MDC2877968.1 thiamine phosphate synthase [Marinicella sp. W31]